MRLRIVYGCCGVVIVELNDRDKEWFVRLEALILWFFIENVC